MPNPSIVRRQLLEDIESGSPPAVSTPESGPKYSDFGVNDFHPNGEVPVKDPAPDTAPEPGPVVPTTEQEVNTDSGREEISSLLKQYEEARKKSEDRAADSALFAGLQSDPRRGEMMRKNDESWVNEPTSAITDRFGLTEKASKAHQTVDDMDANSAQSQAMRAVLEKHGITVPKTSTAAQLKEFLPFLKPEITYQTGQGAQQTSRDNTDKIVEQKTAAEGVKHGDRVTAEEGKNTRAHNLIEAGVVRDNKRNATALAVAYLSQQGRASGPAAAKFDQSISQIPREVPDVVSADLGGHVLVPDTENGVMPTSTDGPKASEDMNEYARYVSAMRMLRDLTARGVSPLRDMASWKMAQTALASSQQFLVKLHGNGVTNGPDLIQAAKEIGDPTDFFNWLTNNKYGVQKLDTALHMAHATAKISIQSHNYRIGTPAEAAEWVKSNKKFASESAGSVSGPLNPGSPQEIDALKAQALGGEQSPTTRKPLAAPVSTPGGAPSGQTTQNHLDDKSILDQINKIDAEISKITKGKK